MRRNTKQRGAIQKFLAGTRSHPTVDVIYENVKKEISNISIGTVYRNLKVLKEDGLITEINLQGDIGRFEIKQEKHYHFYCGLCGKVTDIDMPLDEKLNERVASRTGFKVSSHQIEFHGLCKNCQ
jgi:Fur family transcriptional regulator, peroxide stress response regulator